MSNKIKDFEREIFKELNKKFIIDSDDAIRKTIKLTQKLIEQQYLDEEKWLEFKEVKFKGKTKKFIVWSKCSDTRLGEIKWYPSWRAYCFIIDFDKIEQFTELLIFSDRCQLQIGYFTKKLNEEHRSKK